jgi:hypothetical protein
VEAQLWGGMNKACQHIIAVPRPSDLRTLERDASFFQGHKIGQDLTGMRIVCQGVNNWHRGILG